MELSSALAVQGCAAAIKTDDAKHIANVCGKNALNVVKLKDNLMPDFQSGKERKICQNNIGKQAIWCTRCRRLW